MAPGAPQVLVGFHFIREMIAFEYLDMRHVPQLPTQCTKVENCNPGKYSHTLFPLDKIKHLNVLNPKKTLSMLIVVVMMS